MARNAAALKKGEKATILAFADIESALKLAEMGCLPGTEITLVRTAPLGCPLYVKLRDTSLALRRNEAFNLIIG